MSASFLPYGEEAAFSATVYNADGEATDFDEIAWSTDLSSDWSLEGAELSDASLDVGTHTLTAEAVLPNGDRLVYAVGGVLVQSIYTGVYTGTMVVDVAAEGYAVACSGATTIVVDVYGETVTGDAGCLISLQGFDLDTSFLVDLSNTEGTLSGDTSVDFGFYALPIGTDGAVDEDGNLSANFAETIDVYYTLDLSGELTATRVSRDVSGY